LVKETKIYSQDEMSGGCKKTEEILYFERCPTYMTLSMALLSFILKKKGG
jgi:hypothetical protein